ncbi:hypothetical protein GCM10009539_03000 [Cryptosporangium japonicum]|uniref:Uncharacterized protein n=1 Tax=Cryptosporangium japonicum TaxID=80872 RepID=A0ABP3D556_9ACTN
MLSFLAAVVAWYVHEPAGYVVPPGVSNAYVRAQMFGDGVLWAVGGPLLGLLLARYFPKRGIAALVLGVLTMTLGFTDSVVSPEVCPVC